MAYSGYCVYKTGSIGKSRYTASVFIGFAKCFLTRRGYTEHCSFSVYVAG